MIARETVYQTEIVVSKYLLTVCCHHVAAYSNTLTTDTRLKTVASRWQRSTEVGNARKVS